MAADYTFDPGLVVSDTTNLPSVNTTGQLLTAAGGTVLNVYDLLGTPVANLVTNEHGYVARFRADVPTGVVSFGSVVQPVVSFEAINSGPQAIAAATAAASAAATSTAAAASALTASNAAAAALAAALAAQAAAEAGGGGGGIIDGGGPDGGGTAGDFDGGLI